MESLVLVLLDSSRIEDNTYVPEKSENASSKKITDFFKSKSEIKKVKLESKVVDWTGVADPGELPNCDPL